MLVSRQLPLLVSPAGSSLALIARLAVLQCRPTMSSFSTYSATAATLNKNDKNESNKKDSKKDNKKEEAETPSPLRLADEGTEHIRFFHEPQRLVDLLTRLPNYGIGMRFAHIKWDHDEAVKASYWTVSNIRISKSKVSVM